MQKASLIAQVAEQIGIPRTHARRIIETMIEVIRGRLAAGEKVVLSGFGTFELRSRQERRGINPRTHEEIRIPATRTPGFTASNRLKARVRERRGQP